VQDHTGQVLEDLGVLVVYLLEYRGNLRLAVALHVLDYLRETKLLKCVLCTENVRVG
jgi:hypothetical protein